MNRYSGSAAVAMPQPQRLEFTGATLAELVDLVYTDVCVGLRDTFTWLSRFGDTFYISTEPELPERGRWRVL